MRSFCCGTPTAAGSRSGRRGSISCREATKGRVRHGVRIDPKTLRGDAGFYGDRDPNCCPSQDLIVHLTVRGDSLVLLRHVVQRAPKGAS